MAPRLQSLHAADFTQIAEIQLRLGFRSQLLVGIAVRMHERIGHVHGGQRREPGNLVRRRIVVQRHRLDEVLR